MAQRIKGITIEIGGDTTGLNTALKSVNAEIKDTEGQLRDINKLLKLDPGNTELIAQKQRALADAVDETRKKLETLKTAQEDANKALANGDITQVQYDGLQREISETENKLKNLEDQAKKSGTALAELGAAGEKIKEIGGKITDTGKKLSVVSAGVAALGTAAIKATSDFDTALSQVQATMGITRDSISEVDGVSVNTMDTLSALAQQMGAETVFSATECAEALNYLALAGYDTQQMVDTLPTVLNLAAAGSFELATASDMVTDAMSALGLDVSDAVMMVDQMAKTASTTNTNVEQLGEGILKIGATARNVAGGTAELNTALGILANVGIKATEGGTHLRNILLALQTPKSEDAAWAFEQLGLQAYDALGNLRPLNDILGDLKKSLEPMTMEEKNNFLSLMFNKTDLAAINALLANTGETWNDLQAAITESGGAAAEMAKTQLDNLEGDLTLLKSALEGLAISIGELIMPIIREVVAALQGVVDWLNSLDEEQKKTIITIAAVAAAIGPVLVAVGNVTTAIGTLFTVIAANPIMAIVAVIGVLVTAIITLWNTNEDFRNFWIGAWENIKSTVSKAIEAIKGFFDGIINFVKSNWQGLLMLLANPFIGAFKLLYDNCDQFRNFIDNLLNNLKQFFENFGNGVKNTVSNIGNAIKTGFDSAIAYIKSLPSQAKQWGVDIINGIVSGIKSMISSVENAVSNVAETIKSFLHFSVPDEGPLTDYESWMPDFMRGLASGIEKSRGMIRKAMQNVSTDMMLNPRVTAAGAGANSTMTHSGVIRVEGVNSAGQTQDVVRIVVDQLRKDRRL